MARRIKTRPTTIHFSMVNRMFLDDLSEREHRTLSAQVDLEVDRLRQAWEQRPCVSEMPHVVVR